MVNKKYRKSRYSKKSRKDNPGKSFHEISIVMLFFALVVLSVIIFWNVPKQIIGSVADNTISLDKSSYKAGQALEGTASLKLEEGDVLPANSTMLFYILSESPKCSLKYACQDSEDLVAWHTNDETLSCELVQQDPEGECCREARKDCTQVLWNKDFNADLGASGRWTRSLNSYFTSDAASIEKEFIVGQDNDGNVIQGNVVYLDSSRSSGSVLKSSALIVRQDFIPISSRLVQIKDFKEIVPQKPYCLDSDNKNHLTKGLCNSSVSGIKYDSCTADDPPQLIEYYCNPLGSTYSCLTETVTCGTGICQDGKCVDVPPEGPQNCVNPASGNNTEIYDMCKEVYLDRTLIYEDVCVNSNYVKQYYCGSDKYCHGFNFSCSGNLMTCSLGKCSVPGGETAGASNQNNALQWRFAWIATGDSGDKACAFEIVVNATDSTGGKRSLHYYYQLDDTAFCSHPAENSANKYIVITEIPEQYAYTGADSEWEIESRNIYADWTGLGWSENDNITGIQLVSHVRNDSSEVIYAQQVFFDYITLAKPGWEEATNCTKLGKKCCLQGTGFGDYFGEQLECSEGYECWSGCADSVEMSLKSFISKSGSSSKYNKTEAPCQAIIDGSVLELVDECAEGYAEKGYTACLTETGTNCRNWTNVYSTEISSSTSKINLKVPGQNGTYSLVWKYQYLPIGSSAEDTITIFEKTASFTVGAGSGSCYPNWVYITNWSECMNGSQFASKRDMNNCSQNAPTYTINENRTCGCTPDSYQCIEGIYQQCSSDGLTWSTIEDCSIEGKSCDISQGCYTPCTPYCNGVKCGSSDSCGGVCIEGSGCTASPVIFKQWYFWLAIILVLAAVFVVLLLTILKKKPKTIGTDQQNKNLFGQGNKSGMSQGFGSKASGQSIQNVNPEYAEVVSYVREALNAGGTKEDIRAKLIEAGWPEDAINQAFKASGI